MEKIPDQFWLHPTVFAGKVLNGDVLNGDFFQEVRTLAAGVARDDAFPPQPITQPGQMTVAVERIGQKVAGEYVAINQVFI